MGLHQIESSTWWPVVAFVLAAVAALVFVICIGRLRRRRLLRKTNPDSVNVTSGRDTKWVSREITRLCSGDDADAALIKQMSAEDRALFEVSVIDALNGGTREGQHRLRSALIKYGYDEQCSRRVMSQDLSDRVRATAVLNLLRPQWRDTPTESELRAGDEVRLRARAAGRSTGPLDVE